MASLVFCNGAPADRIGWEGVRDFMKKRIFVKLDLQT